MTDRILSQKQADLINRGLSQDQLDMAMNMTRKFTTPFWMVVGLIVFLFLGGAIISLITAGIATKNKPIFDDSNDASGNNAPQV